MCLQRWSDCKTMTVTEFVERTCRTNSYKSDRVMTSTSLHFFQIPSVSCDIESEGKWVLTTLVSSSSFLVCTIITCNTMTSLPPWLTRGWWSSNSVRRKQRKSSVGNPRQHRLARNVCGTNRYLTLSSSSNHPLIVLHLIISSPLTILASLQNHFSPSHFVIWDET